MQSQFLIWQCTLGLRVTINFTFNCQQVLITGITAALNVGLLLIFLPVKKVNRLKEINIAHPSTEVSFGVHNLIFITCKYGAEVKKEEIISLSFDECVESQWNPFWWWAFSHKCTIGHSQRAFNGTVICCPVRHHSWSAPRQLMELHGPANGCQRARSSLCGQNGSRYPFSFLSLWNEEKTS